MTTRSLDVLRWLFSGLVGLSLLAVCPPGLAQEAEEEKETEKQEAEEDSFNAKDYFQEVYELTKTAEAEADFTEIIRRCEESLKEDLSDAYDKYAHRVLAWGHNKRGEVRDAEGQDKEAFADFDTAVKQAPEGDKRFYRYHYNRGVSHAKLGRFEEAAEDFQAAIRLNGDFEKAHFNLGEVYFVQGQIEDAIAAYTAAIRRDSRYADAYNARGFAQYRRGNYASAISDYSRAISLDDDFVEAYVNRADAYGDIGRFDRALRDYQTAINLDDEDAWAFRGAAWLRATCPSARYRNAELAVRSADRAVELAGDDDPRFLDVQAAAYAEAGEFDKAQKIVSRAIELAQEQGLDEYAAEISERLALYKKDEPYRAVREEG